MNNLDRPLPNVPSSAPPRFSFRSTININIENDEWKKLVNNPLNAAVKSEVCELKQELGGLFIRVLLECKRKGEPIKVYLYLDKTKNNDNLARIPLIVTGIELIMKQDNILGNLHLNHTCDKTNNPQVYNQANDPQFNQTYNGGNFGNEYDSPDDNQIDENPLVKFTPFLLMQKDLKGKKLIGDFNGQDLERCNWDTKVKVKLKIGFLTYTDLVWN